MTTANVDPKSDGRAHSSGVLDGPMTADPPKSEVRVSHLAICVTDLERSIRFYRDGLGFTPQLTWRRSEGAVTGDPLGVPGDVQGQYLGLHGMTIELLWFESPGPVSTTPRPMNQVGFTHITVLVDDLAATVERLVAHGGDVLESTRVDYDLPHALGSLVFCTDPDGTRLEINQRSLRDPAGRLPSTADGDGSR